MSEAYARALATVMELPEAERLALADAVYASLPIPDGALCEDDPNFDAIIRGRFDDLKSGRVKGIPGDEYLKRLREKRVP
jgi:hypothetical protein